MTYTPSNSLKHGREYHFELKCVDGTANPYLALSAILTAGFHGGISKKLNLDLKELTGECLSLLRSVAAL